MVTCVITCHRLPDFRKKYTSINDDLRQCIEQICGLGVSLFETLSSGQTTKIAVIVQWTPDVPSLMVRFYWTKATDNVIEARGPGVYL